MGFVKLTRVKTEYAGESITEAISRTDGAVWDSELSAKYTLYTNDGSEVAADVLARSTDDKQFLLKVSKTITAPLDGRYLLLVELVNSTDTDISDVIAEYNITFLKRKG